MRVIIFIYQMIKDKWHQMLVTLSCQKIRLNILKIGPWVLSSLAVQQSKVALEMEVDPNTPETTHPYHPHPYQPPSY